MQKITIKKILNKKGKKPITCLTAYSKSTAEAVDKYCDIILVGDSMGMAFYGMKSTREMTIDTMILHGKTVKNFAKRSLVIIDMPFKTYSNKFIAYKNAMKIMRVTKCDGVKLEGGIKVVPIVKYLTKKGIPVMGHIGLLPQSEKNYKLKGKNIFQKNKILQDAVGLSNAGTFAIVIECVVEDLAKKITNNISVPTIGIGASKYCDGQILVLDDMIGLNNFKPKFVKKYSNIKIIMEKAIKSYCRDVNNRTFPSKKNIYKLK